jgi:hypothetical protein
VDENEGSKEMTIDLGTVPEMVREDVKWAIDKFGEDFIKELIEMLETIIAIKCGTEGKDKDQAEYDEAHQRNESQEYVDRWCRPYEYAERFCGLRDKKSPLADAVEDWFRISMDICRDGTGWLDPDAPSEHWIDMDWNKKPFAKIGELPPKRDCAAIGVFTEDDAFWFSDDCPIKIGEPVMAYNSKDAMYTFTPSFVRACFDESAGHSDNELMRYIYDFRYLGMPERWRPIM